MANENIVQTRISLKYDTYEKWSATANQKVLLRGEIAIATLATDLAQEVNNTTKQPILFKVGDGTSTFNQLPWASALAADVYAWAKAKEVVRNGKVLQFKDDKGNVVDSVTFDYLTQAEVDARVTAVTGALTSLTTSAKGTLVAAINEHDTEIGTLTSLTTSAKNNLVAAINEHDTELGNVGSLTTTAKNVAGAINEHDTEIGDLTKLNTTNKTSLVNAVNEALQAVEVGGTGSVVTVVKDTNTAETDTYTVKQGGNAVGDKITVGTADLTVEATGALSGSGTFNANATADKTITITHKTSGVTAGQYGADNNVTLGEGDSETINIPSVTVDAQGHVTAAADKVLSISIPKIPDNHVTTNTEQEITGEKTFTEDITVSSIGYNGEYGFEGTIIRDDEIIVTKVRGYDAEVNETKIGLGYVKVEDEDKHYATFSPQGFNTSYGNFLFPRIIDEETGEDNGTTIATLSDVRQIAAGAVDYLGTISGASGLSTEAGRGDFYRVTLQFTVGDNTAHVGDLVVAEKNNPEAKLDGTNWTVIHGHEGQIVKVTGEGGLTGSGTTGEVKLSIADSGVTTAKINNGAVTEAKLDTTLANKINNKKDKQTAVSDPTANGKALAFIDSITQNADGVITATKKNVDLGAYATTQSVTDAINALDVSNITGMGAGKTIKTLTETDGKIAATFQDISITASQVSNFSTAVAAVKVTNATNADNATKATQDASGNVITTTYATKTELTDAVNALDSSVTATAATNDEYSVLTGVTQTDGKLTAKTEVKLAKIAKTGSIYDITEGSNTSSDGVKYIIFDCGTATTVI